MTDQPLIVDRGSARPSLYSTLGRIASKVHSPQLSRGDRAELRRMRSDGIPPEVFWRVTEDLPGTDDFWLAILPLMVRFPHEGGARVGKVLAANRVKPSRVTRWLRRDRETAWEEAMRLLGPARGASIDWGNMGMLMHQWDQGARRQFAKEYFATLHRMERTGNQSTGERV